MREGLLFGGCMETKSPMAIQCRYLGKPIYAIKPIKAINIGKVMFPIKVGLRCSNAVVRAV